jgi:hypothetical protein
LISIGISVDILFKTWGIDKDLLSTFGCALDDDFHHSDHEDDDKEVDNEEVYAETIEDKTGSFS